MKCGKQCEVFSRIVGYHRPIQQWNKGKREEFKDRTEFQENITIASNFATLGKPTATAQSLENY